MGDDRVLIRVSAASVNPLDWHAVSGTPYLVRLQGGVRRPKQTTPGADVAGHVEAVGSAVAGLRVGDRVFGTASGSFAEYATASARSVVVAPDRLDDGQAACVPIAGLTALQALRDKGLAETGRSVLVIGAAGGVGTFAVQIAKALGCEVTGVCSTRNVDLVRSIGADHVVDYTRDDLARGSGTYDVIVDNIGNLSVATRRRLMTRKGRCVIVGGPKTGRVLGPMSSMVRAVAVSPFVSQAFVPMLAKVDAADLEVLRGMIDAGDVTPVVTATYSLADVPRALDVIGGGHARGKMAVAVGAGVDADDG
jgi:NADPH:quinone reductase-like Zn-dependent oxidoreductase